MIKDRAGHVFHECDCGRAGCMFCDGGLGYCAVCGGLEGSLTPKKCPGFKMTMAQNDKVYADYTKRRFEDPDFDIDAYINELRAYAQRD